MKTIQTDSDTTLSVQLCKCITTSQLQRYKTYEIALTLKTETGGDEDGEQTTILTSPQVDVLIAELQQLQSAIKLIEKQNRQK